MKISRNEKVRCGWCFKDSLLGEWNDLTFSKCTNREMKRDFTQLSDSKAFLHKSNTFYLCPKCNTWSRGSQLRIVDTANEALKRLGGESVTNPVKSSN